MLYSYQEPKERDMATHFEHSQVEQVSHPCEKKWEISEIDCERINYFEYDSTFEGKEDLGEDALLVINVMGKIFRLMIIVVIILYFLKELY